MSTFPDIIDRSRHTHGGPATLIVGTARSVRQLCHSLHRADQPLHLVGCVLICPQHDDEALGLPVLGAADALSTILQMHRFELALVSVPTAMSQAQQRVRQTLTKHGIATRTMPTLDDQLTGRFDQPNGAIDLNDLLGRPHRPLDEAAISKLLVGRRVLITGAGGSIGGELARIVARFEPAALLLMERSENNLFDIHRQLRAQHADTAIHAILHDVTHAERTAALCRQLQPQIVFHAAAHKHVPMMEDHPRAAVENNLFGTKSIADAAHACAAERFVMISTDKAVNPTSVMGATKRLAELYIQSLNATSGTDYSMVRFGNVLGSACSVVPIWGQQLAEGGPITVTDPRMTRYFMTIPEAAALVIQAATLEHTAGQVLLLDMGEPIRVLDMAKRFARCHGLEPERDVAIVFTGTRPGEKLFEELAYDGEQMVPTACDSVRIWQTTPPTTERMGRIIDTFGALRHSDDAPAIHAALRQALPEMRPMDDAAPPLSRSA